MMRMVETDSNILDSDYTKNVVNSFFFKRDANSGTSYDRFSVNREVCACAQTTSGHVPVSRIVCSWGAHAKKEYNDSKANRDKNKKISLIMNLWKRIDKLKQLGIDQIDEDIEVGPTEEVLDKVRAFIPGLVFNHFFPFRITPSIDEGICLGLQNERVRAYIEFYNDGDIGIIAEDYIDKTILKNVDVEEAEIITTLKTIF